MYIFGGFNGIMLNDIYKFSPGKCVSYMRKDECLLARQGVKCWWSEERNECMLREDAITKFNQKVLSVYPHPANEQCEEMEECKWQCHIGMVPIYPQDEQNTYHIPFN